MRVWSVRRGVGRSVRPLAGLLTHSIEREETSFRDDRHFHAVRP